MTISLFLKATSFEKRALLKRWTTMFKHTTVLLKETVDGLNINPDGIYVDCTLGGAGHSELILSKLSDQGKLYAFDQDDIAIGNAKEKLAPIWREFNLIKSNFLYLKEELKNREIF